VFLAATRGRVLTHQHVLRRSAGPHADAPADTCAVLVASLRKKLEPDPSHPTYIQTSPGSLSLHRPSSLDT